MVYQWTISHDFAFTFGGAELVTRAISRDVLSDAEVVYLAGDESVARKMSSHTRRILPNYVTSSTYRHFTPFYPSMLRREPQIEGNILASSYCFAHYLDCTGTKYVYCHTPFRQAWSGAQSYASSGSLAERIGTRALGPYLRRTDLAASRTAHMYIATSTAVRDRIVRYYGRNSVPIVPPPLELYSGDVIGESQREGLLWVGRIVEPYKRLALLIDAIRDRPNLKLTIVGDGRDAEALAARAPANVSFVGWIEHAKLRDYYKHAEMLIFPGEDDFGIVPIEAMAFGTPVVALNAGGAIDTVVPHETGLLFDELSTAELLSAIDNARKISWNYASIASRTRGKYAVDSFARRLGEVLE